MIATVSLQTNKLLRKKRTILATFALTFELNFDGRQRHVDLGNLLGNGERRENAVDNVADIMFESKSTTIVSSETVGAHAHLALLADGNGD